jgi:hypothetical protein
MFVFNQKEIFMNKITKMAALFVALAVTFSFSQESSLKFGARVGFNLLKSKLGWEEQDDKIEMGMGFGAGLVASIPLTSQLSLNPELAFYSRKVFSIKEEFFEDGWSAGVEMSELAVSIPVLLQFTPVEGSPFYLAAGVQVDIPISPEMKYIDSKGEDGRSIEWTDDFLTKHRTIDFGIALGLGYMIMPNLGVDLRCVIGMTSLFEDFTEKYYYDDGDYEPSWKKSILS